MARNSVDISTGAINAPADGVASFAPNYSYRASDYSRRRRRGKKCVVM